MQWISKNIVLLSIVFLASACTQAPNAILRKTPLGVDEFISTDSRLRIVTNSGIGVFSRPGMVDPQRIICSEPSPDVAVAVANSLAVGISILGQGSGSITSQQTEGLAQLVERTATIQLLRDKMYQTCLAYSNGAITGTTYSLIMSRLDDTIVTLLLGETAGGAFGRSLAGVGVESNAQARASLVGLPKGIGEQKDLSDDLALAQQDVDEKTQALRAAEANQPKDSDEDSDEVTEAKADLKQSQENRDELLKRLQSKIKTSASAAGAVKNLSVGGGLTRTPTPELARELANIQENFLIDDFSDSLVSACLVEMALQQEDRNSAGAMLDQIISSVAALQAELDDIDQTLSDGPIDSLEFLEIYGISRVDLKNRKKTLLYEIESRKNAVGDLSFFSSQAVQTSRGLANISSSSDLYYWLKNLDKPNLADMVGAIHLNRGSKLAAFCGQNLDVYLNVGRDQFHDYRLERLKHNTSVRNARAIADTEKAKARQAEMKLCEKVDKKSILDCIEKVSAKKSESGTAKPKVPKKKSPPEKKTPPAKKESPPAKKKTPPAKGKSPSAGAKSPPSGQAAPAAPVTPVQPAPVVPSTSN